MIAPSLFRKNAGGKHIRRVCHGICGSHPGSTTVCYICEDYTRWEQHSLTTILKSPLCKIPRYTSSKQYFTPKFLHRRGILQLIRTDSALHTCRITYNVVLCQEQPPGNCFEQAASDHRRRRSGSIRSQDIVRWAGDMFERARQLRGRIPLDRLAWNGGSHGERVEPKGNSLEGAKRDPGAP